MQNAQINVTPVIKELNHLLEEYKTDDRIGSVLGIDPSHITNIRAGRRYPGPRILKALGMERVVTYRKVKHD